MKKAKALFTLATLSILGLSTISNSVLETKGEEVSINNLDVEDSYNIGDLLFISKDVTLSKDGKDTKVTASYLTYPNGSSKSSSSYKLDSYGKYTLLLVGEDKITYTKSFSVFKDVYTFGGDKSSIDYGSLNPQFASSGYPYGLKVGLTEGDTFTFSKPIDLSKSKYQKLIMWNVKDIGVNPSVHSITVRVTDAYDPENYFTITNSKGSYYYENYISAGFNGSRIAGLSKDDSGTITIDSTNYRISPTGGTSITGNNPTSNVYNNVSYYLDTSNPSNYRIYAENDQARNYALVSELNNPSIYPDTNFAGFKTGLVYISLTATGYSGVDSAPIEIGEIGGIKGESLNPMDYYKDEINPIIDLNAKKKANVVGGLEIKIPEAKAFDETALSGDLKKTVYYGYDSSSKKMIAVKNDSFTPTEKGIYTIIYEATDVYGNVGTERIDLFVSSFGEEGIHFEVKPLEGLKAGTLVKFDNFEATSLNDDCITKVEVKDPSGKIDVISSTDQYKLEKAGKYHLTYRYQDSFYSGKKEYEFDVDVNNNATFETDKVSLPHYFMKGSSYTIDVPNAYTYGKDGESKDKILSYVKFDDGEYKEFDPLDLEISGNKYVSFKFVPESNPSTLIETDRVNIIDTGYDGKNIYLTKYFVGDFTGKDVKDSEGKNADYVRYQSKLTGNGSMEFINKLLLSGFEFSFKTNISNKVRIHLIPFSSGEEVTIEFEASKVSVNGRTQAASENYQGSGATILYSSTNSTLTVAGANFTLDNPFKDDSFLLKIEAEGLKESSYIDISKVGNQPFRSYSNRDRIQPMASALFPEQVAHVGERSTLYKPNVADVLTPVSDKNIFLTVVKNISGSVKKVKDVNSGKEISSVSDFSSNYEIEYDEYGSYVISYGVLDGAGNSISGGLKGLVSVIDREVPVITTKVSTHTIKANVASALPVFEGTDNLTSPEKLEIWHLVYNDKKVLTASVSNGDKATISTKGTYTVYVTVQDEEGNTAYSEYTLIVE